MNINLHIERLILDGLPVTRAQGGLVQAAVEAELVRLLTEGGISSSLLAGSALPHLPVSAIHLTSESNPAQMGQQIAQAVYGGIGNGEGFANSFRRRS